MKIVFENLLKHCFEVYSGKIGWSGMPYILYPLAVMSKVDSLPEKSWLWGTITASSKMLKNLHK